MIKRRRTEIISRVFMKLDVELEKIFNPYFIRFSIIQENIQLNKLSQELIAPCVVC